MLALGYFVILIVLCVSFIARVLCLFNNLLVSGRLLMIVDLFLFTWFEFVAFACCGVLFVYFEYVLWLVLRWLLIFRVVLRYILEIILF